jgi:hypothetical protein
MWHITSFSLMLCLQFRRQTCCMVDSVLPEVLQSSQLGFLPFFNRLLIEEVKETLPIL